MFPVSASNTGEVEPSAVRGLVPVVLSHLAVDDCYAPFPANCYSTTTLLSECDRPPSTENNAPFDYRIQEASLFTFKVPGFKAYIEQTGVLGIGPDCYNPSPYSTHQPPAPFPSTDPRLLLDYPCTMSTIPPPMIDRPQNQLADDPPPNLSKDLAGIPKGSFSFLGMHEGKKYKCLWSDEHGGVCGYVETQCRVERHIRDLHVGREMICSFCSRPFSKSYDLKLHYNNHTGESPYGCGGCEETFKNPSSLRRHRIKRHGHIPKKRLRSNRAAGDRAE